MYSESEFDQALFDAYSKINALAFGGVLPPVIIGVSVDEDGNPTICRDGRFKNMAAVYLHKPGEEPAIILNNRTDRRRLDRTDIIIIYHEMLHHYCAVNDLDDGNGVYHNKLFKLAAEKNHGSARWIDEEYGFMDAAPDEEILKLIIESIG